MRIVELRAENFKRLTAVDIKPDGDVVQITGRNEQGKSSVLDSIWAALGGAEVLPGQPIHKGADEASVYLDLGDIKVTRKFKRKDGDFTTSLLVENADGSRPRSPQTLLDELVGRFSLDPLAFSRMKAGEQFEALKAIVPNYDFTKAKDDRQAAFDRRTVENRKAKEARAAAAAIGAPDKLVVPVDESGILADIARAGEFNASIEQRKARRKEVEYKVEALDKAIANDTAEVADLERRLGLLRTAITERSMEAEQLRTKLKQAPELPQPLDTVTLSERLAGARTINADAQKQQQRDDLLLQAQAHEKNASDLTAAIEAVDTARKAAIAAAELPVEGLSLGDDEVLVDGFPFAQAAASKKIRISVALAMALNPKIRVIRIMDGSLLDSEAMRTIQRMAAEKDYQVWVERVDAGVGVVIEDGHVAEPVQNGQTVQNVQSEDQATLL